MVTGWVVRLAKRGLAKLELGHEGNEAVRDARAGERAHAERWSPRSAADFADAPMMAPTARAGKGHGSAFRRNAETSAQNERAPRSG